jgi:hypothetical protein
MYPCKPRRVSGLSISSARVNPSTNAARSATGSTIARLAVGSRIIALGSLPSVRRRAASRSSHPSISGLDEIEPIEVEGFYHCRGGVGVLPNRLCQQVANARVDLITV